VRAANYIYSLWRGKWQYVRFLFLYKQIYVRF